MWRPFNEEELNTLINALPKATVRQLNYIVSDTKLHK